MFKQGLICMVALSVGMTGAFGAASVRSIGILPHSGSVGAVTRAGTLRMQPTTAVGKKSVSTGTTLSENISGDNTTRMSSISGITGVGSKPKLSSSTSAATLADLKKQVADLANVVSDMLSAGVDEKAVRDIIDSELAAKNFATSDDLNQKADKEDVISSDVTFSEENGYIVLTSGKTKANVVALSDIQGGQGTPGANACEPKYSSKTNADGDTVVTITCADNESNVLGQYTVAKGADGAPGTNGTSGASAYQIWLDAGNTGTEADFLASLKGADGTSVKIKGTVPTCAALNSLTNVSAGDIYLVTGDNNMGYIYDGTSFPNCPGNGIQIQGPQGQACLSTLTTQVCGPDLTKKCPIVTRSGTVYTKTDCNGTNPTDDVIYNGDDGDDICDNVENPATSVKTYTKTYTAHTASLPGYVTLTQTMCNNTTNTTNYQDSCVPIIPRTNQNICSDGTYMECTAQNDGTVYNVCKPKDTDDADTVFTALKDKLSKNVTFATETVNDVESFVLKEGSNTVAVLATKSELKGETPCQQGLNLVEDDNYTGSGKKYNLVCDD